ncbi:MAG: twin-arginine translocase subunit TatC [Candidatus Marinimicrobia bacterium]|nr:twin-arginine translocase subunit TatC [Candidatus Neomarinimicrobiota bacterium]
MSLNKNMTFIEHLEQLRWVFLRVIILNLILMCVAFVYSNQIQDILVAPINSLGLENFYLQDIKITSPFMAKIIISLFSAIIISFPHFIFEVYRFIYPAISNVSKIFLFFIFIFSNILFLFGCFFGYTYLLPVSISFFVRLIDQNVTFAPERVGYIFYSFWLIVVSGFVYQLPVISLILTKLKIINYEFLKQMRPYSIVLFLVLGAFLSPPDPLSQLLIALPLYILYELSIIISYFFRVKS